MVSGSFLSPSNWGLPLTTHGRPESGDAKQTSKRGAIRPRETSAGGTALCRRGDCLRDDHGDTGKTHAEFGTGGNREQQSVLRRQFNGVSAVSADAVGSVSFLVLEAQWNQTGRQFSNLCHGFHLFDPRKLRFHSRLPEGRSGLERRRRSGLVQNVPLRHGGDFGYE